MDEAEGARREDYAIAVISAGGKEVNTTDPVIGVRAEGTVLFIWNGFHEYDFDLCEYSVSLTTRAAYQQEPASHG